MGAVFECKRYGANFEFEKDVPLMEQLEKGSENITMSKYYQFIFFEEKTYLRRIQTINMLKKVFDNCFISAFHLR